MSARPDAPSALARLASCLPDLAGGAAWLAWRRAALAVLASEGLPTPRDDAWKYTNLRLLERRDLAPAITKLVPTSALDAHKLIADGTAARATILRQADVSAS